jgi:hypothetical protein
LLRARESLRAKERHMSYEQKIEQAREAIAANNESAHSGGGTGISTSDFFQKLRLAGGTTLEALQECSWEDLQECGLPKFVAKRVAKIFREREQDKKRPTVITERRAQGMAVAELLEHYDPRDPDNPVGKRLSTLSNGGRCIVFNDNGTVNVEPSTTLVDELRDKFPERETMVVDERPRQTFRIGERPDMTADENPLYPGRMLRPDGTCDQTNRSWAGVPFDVRVLVHLTVKETREVVVNQLNDAHTVMDMVFGDDAESKIRQRYSQASVMFDALKQGGGLPSLKLMRTGQNGNGLNNPFGGKHRRF